jgi:hypothetical protein
MTHTQHVYDYSRQALYAELGCEFRGKRILMPSFTCAEFVGVFKALNCKISFLRMNEKLEFIDHYTDWPVVDLVVLTHYLGCESDSSSIRKYAKINDCKVLEDNAHAVESLHNCYDVFSNNFDFEIISYRKSHNLEYGAILNIKNHQREQTYNINNNNLTSLKKLYLNIKAYLRRLGFLNYIRFFKFLIFGFYKTFERVQNINKPPLNTLFFEVYAKKNLYQSFNNEKIRSKEKKITTYLDQKCIVQLGKMSSPNETPFGIIISSENKNLMHYLMLKFNVNVFPWPQIHLDAKDYVSDKMMKSWVICLL